jgi:hypothetical protein
MLSTLELSKVVYPLHKMEFNVNETMSLLTRYGFKFWSWGVSKRMSFENKSLCLKVSGHHHKGWVVITLDWLHTYIVYIISNKGEILDTYDMVYFDELFDIIDKRIEFIEKYQS